MRRGHESDSMDVTVRPRSILQRTKDRNGACMQLRSAFPRGININTLQSRAESFVRRYQQLSSLANDNKQAAMVPWCFIVYG